MCIRFWAKVGERDHLEDIDANGKRIKVDLQKKYVKEAWSGWISLRLGIRGGLL